MCSIYYRYMVCIWCSMSSMGQTPHHRHDIVISEAIFLPSWIAAQPERGGEIFFSAISYIWSILASQHLTFIHLTKWIFGGLWIYKIGLGCTFTLNLVVQGIKKTPLKTILCWMKLNLHNNNHLRFTSLQVHKHWGADDKTAFQRW